MSDKGFSAASHSVTRLVFDVDVPFDEFRARYEEAVPAFNPACLGEFGTWEAVLERTPELAPNGFLRYGTVDVGPVMSLAGHTSRCVTYLMGNHTVAETMFRHDPGVMLYAPLRTVLYEDRDGGTHFAIDQPSTRFASFEQPDIAATGRQLDRRLAELLAVLDLPVPETLVN